MNVKKPNYLLQVAHECIINTEYAIKSLSESNSAAVSIQFMNQAFQCAKQLQQKWDLMSDVNGRFLVEQFYHQFLFANQTFLNSVENGSREAVGQELATMRECYAEMRDGLAD